MSKQYFKSELKYDNNCGSLDSQTIYIIENNSTDYRYTLYEDGSEVVCVGTDSYYKALVVALELESGCGPDWYCKTSEIQFEDLPDSIKKFDYGKH